MWLWETFCYVSWKSWGYTQYFIVCFLYYVVIKIDKSIKWLK